MAGHSLPKASLADTLAVMAKVAGPLIAKGVIIRRATIERMAERLDLETGAIRLLQKLRRKYGEGPLMLRLPFREQAVLLAPDHVHKVLNATPEPFATASSEKYAALSHFEPEGALISHGAERAERRRFNEDVLDHDCPVHRLAGRFEKVVEEETSALLDRVVPRGTFGWDDFSIAWFRIIRRVVFGDGARHDVGLRRLIDKLRHDANWAFAKPRRDHLYRLFQQRLQRHLARAEPGSLAQLIAGAPKDARTKPEQQVPQWLFASDPAGMATIRALALLATHPEQEQNAREEISQSGQHMPFLRAALLESLRLWPTTPAILRQTTEATEWEKGLMAAGTGILIFAPFFHRDDERLPHAHHFAPELWIEEPPGGGWPLVPFSGGPGICPARNLVLLLGSLMLRRLLQGHRIALCDPGRLDPERLPATLDHFSLRFRIAAGPQPTRIASSTRASASISN